MIVRLLLAIVIIVALFVFLHWFRNRPPHQVSEALKKAALYGVIGLLILLAVTGRLHWLIALLASLAPFIKRLLPLVRYIPILGLWYRRYKARHSTTSKATTGHTSQVETRFIRMTLDHDSGRIDGTLHVAGPLNGKLLSQLTLEQLLECWRQWQQQDLESIRLLEAYLDQSHGPQWRDHVDAGNHDSSQESQSTLSENEALAILGLKDRPSRDAIIQAHRHLISKLHPDRGGSTYLAAKVNLAKDLLLSRIQDAETD
jgi:hypothetical protein